VIIGFKHKGLEKFFGKGTKSGIQAKHAERLRLILGRLNVSINVDMHNPPHPGEVLKKLCLEPLGLRVTKAAQALGVSRTALSNLLHGRTGVTPEMAMRLSIAFDTTAESWMNQQVQYDLWQARQHRGKFHVTRLSNGERVAA
jgi:antitoxin HigA-1